MLQYITDTSLNLEKALKGGCRWVQLRMKEATDEEFISTAKEVGALCRKYGATFIVDDRVETVTALGADGVHLGKNDMPVAEARTLLGEKAIIGATANTFNDIEAAARAGADYIGLGPFRFTTTKKNLSPELGTEGYRSIMKRCREAGIDLPTVAIGGITCSDIDAIMATGVTGVAISGAISRSDNPERTTHEILNKINIWKN